MKQIELELSFQATYLTGWGLRGAWKRGRVQSNILTATWNSWPEIRRTGLIRTSFSLATIWHMMYRKAGLPKLHSLQLKPAFGMCRHTHCCITYSIQN